MYSYPPPYDKQLTTHYHTQWARGRQKGVAQSSACIFKAGMWLGFFLFPKSEAVGRTLTTRPKSLDHDGGLPEKELFGLFTGATKGSWLEECTAAWQCFLYLSLFQPGRNTQGRVQSKASERSGLGGEHVWEHESQIEHLWWLYSAAWPEVPYP